MGVHLRPNLFSTFPTSLAISIITALNLEELVGTTHTTEAICVRQQVVKTVNRPQDIDDEDAMIFFGGDMGDAEKSTG